MLDSLHLYMQEVFPEATVKCRSEFGPMQTGDFGVEVEPPHVAAWCRITFPDEKVVEVQIADGLWQRTAVQFEDVRQLLEERHFADRVSEATSGTKFLLDDKGLSIQ